MLTNLTSIVKNVGNKFKSNKERTRDLEERLTQEDPGRTIRNESIVPPLEVEGEGMPKLRPIDIKFAVALDVLGTTTDNYAYASFVECFNWDDVAEQLSIDDEGDWFVVVFRSIRSSKADSQMLYNADRMAHEEAKQSGGLLKYWYGDLNQHRECLATCIWASLDFARLAIVKPFHRMAASLASEMYETYDLERYSIIKRKGDPALHIKRI